MKTLYSNILACLQQDKPLVAVTIIEQQGSAPRTAGTKMLVSQNASMREDVSIMGTVGGGLYEAKAIGLAKELFAAHADTTPDTMPNTPSALVVSFDLRGKHFPTDMDMICGGALRLLIEYIPVTKATLALYTAIVEAEHTQQAGTIITRIHAVPNAQLTEPTSYAVMPATSLYPLQAPPNSPTDLPPAVKDCVSATQTHATQAHTVQSCVCGEYEYILEPMHRPYTMHIFGAGHVSFALAKITQYLDFKNMVIDDRAEFSNADRFPHATTFVFDALDYTHVVEYFAKHAIGEYDGIVIVTRGHARDRDVLAASLETQAGYIGMIGSKSKRQATYDYLAQIGHDARSFGRIHSPIGIAIGAQTPQEIAISISAELIQWRAGHR